MITSGSDPGDENETDVAKNNSISNKTADAHMIWVAQFDNEFPIRDPDVYREDIGGLDDIIQKLDTFAMGIEHERLYNFMGINPPNGFMLHGPPGTGKTMLAKYLAHNIGARFVDLPLQEFESKWVGDAEKTLGEKLEKMLMYHRITGSKVLLFMDEAEEALKDRRLDGWHGPRVNLLLRYMDGLGENRGIIYGAATNHIDKVDPAFLRAGRLDFVINIPEYNTNQLSQVVMAVANTLNNKSPHHNPYEITQPQALQLAQEIKNVSGGPSDVKEIYRLAAEDKIRQIVKGKISVLTKPDYTVNYDDLSKIVSTYKRVSEKKIGF